jgi:hypothetical protein
MQVCPTASCINLDLFWFLEASGCICASETIQDVSRLSYIGELLQLIQSYFQ